MRRAPAYVKAMLYRSAASLIMSEAADKLAKKSTEIFNLKNQKKKTKNTQPVYTGVGTLSMSSTKGIEKDIIGNTIVKKRKELNKERDTFSEIIQSLKKEALKIEKEFNLNIFDEDNDDKTTSSTVDKHQSFLDKIVALDKEYARKSFTKDEEELQALRDKFSKIRDEIEKFNADPKNKAKQISITGLDATETKAVKELGYRQDTDKIASDLEKKKQVFADFEDTKKQLGIAKAQEMYADQMAGFDTYLEYIEDQAWQQKSAYKAVADGTATGGEYERVDMFTKAETTEEKEQQNKFTGLLASLQNYEQKRLLLIEQYNEKRIELIASGQETEVLDKQHQEGLADLDDNYAHGTDQYKALINGVANLSTIAAKTVISNAKIMVAALVSTGRLSEQAASDIKVKIQALEKQVSGSGQEDFNKIADKIFAITNALSELGSAVGYFDEGLGDSLETMGELSAMALDLGSAIASGEAVQIISASISAIAGLFSIAARAKESERVANEELLQINNSIEDGARRMLAIQRERNIEKAEELGLTLKGIDAQREALKLAATGNVQDQKSLLSELQGLEYISGSHTEKYGGFLGIGKKTRVVDEYSSLMGVTIEEMEEMYHEDRLDDRAKELFEQLQTLQSEGADINAMIDDLTTQTQALFTATTSEAISDSIIDGLRDGYSSFESFAGDVEKILQEAILNGIRMEMIEEPMKKLYAQFAEDAESGGELTAEEAQDFRDGYKAILEAAAEREEQLSEVLDQDLLDSESEGLSSAVRRELTEETASELAGLWRGVFDITKVHKQISQEHLDVANRVFDILNNMYLTVVQTEVNTANTVIELKLAVVELKEINSNTQTSTSTSTTRDIGL